MLTGIVMVTFSGRLSLSAGFSCITIQAKWRTCELVPCSQVDWKALTNMKLNNVVLYKLLSGLFPELRAPTLDVFNSTHVALEVECQGWDVIYFTRRV